MNRLQYESSPYLQQHKNNPVDWYPWGEEALQKARNEDRVIILSVGYSTCHWCHVMEHESFEDQQVAEVMNANFVCIKVDREERPDIDAIYMDALQNMGKSGGWPMNMFLIPGGEPFFGGTYFPKKQWIEILNGVARVYKDQKDDVLKAASGFKESLNEKDSDRFLFGEFSENEIGFTPDEIRSLKSKLAKDFDKRNGGMNRAPKFPMPSLWLMMDHLNQFINDKEFGDHIGFTLKRMVLGGIFDHLGGGWMRYSTDSRWKIPHFEKMLYDNGQLLSLFSEHNDDSQNRNLFQWAVEQTYNWLSTDMNQPNGGFYSAQDADSEGEEGKFYIWTKDETDELLGNKASQFNYAYQITEAGNWEHNKNILHLEVIPEHWEEIKKSGSELLKIRKTRIYPGLDNKTIVSWNAFAISGLVARSKAFDDDYLLAGEKLDFLNNQLRFESKTGMKGVYHQGGDKKILGFLEDYAALILANIDYYSVSFNENYLFTADELLEYTLKHFYDETEELFFFTDNESEELIARKKEIFDNVIPSSNAMIAKALYFAGRYLDKPKYVDLSKQMFVKMKPMVMADPQWLYNWTDLGLLLTGNQKEIVITGDKAIEWITQLRKQDKSKSTLYFAAEKESRLSIFNDRFSDKSTIFICENYSCKLPVYDLKSARDLLNEN